MTGKRGKRKEERGKRKEERGKRKEERGKRKEERGKRKEGCAVAFPLTILLCPHLCVFAPLREPVPAGGVSVACFFNQFF